MGDEISSSHQTVKRKAPNWWKFKLASNYKGFGEITP